MATGTRSLRPVEGPRDRVKKRAQSAPAATNTRLAFLSNPSISKPVELGRERLARGSIRRATQLPDLHFNPAISKSYSGSGPPRGLGGGFNSTELVATLRICSWPGENRPSAGYSMRSSAAVLQLLTAQTNCQFSNIVRRQPLKCHW
jgi:hypothetical protein